ncbi:retrovirus-related pol polyprotein from transposon TNT 1-94 [Tanacetum coccineum]
MDSIIPLGQKNTLAKYMILSGADNHPPMLDKDLYDSWKSRMELYMQNREHERMILESVENGLLIWPTVEENGATNIILQGLPADIYSLVIITELPRIYGEEFKLLWLVKDLHTTNFDQLHAYLEQHELHANEVHLLLFIQQSSASTTVSTISIWINSSHSTLLIYLSNTTSIQSFIRSTIISISISNHQTLSVPQIAYRSPQVTTQSMTESPLVDSGFAILVFSLGDDPIACLNKAMAFLIAVASLSNATSSGGNNASGQARIVKCYNCQGEGHMARQCTQPKRPRNAAWYKDKVMLAEAQEAGQILDEEQLAFLADLGVPDDGRSFLKPILNDMESKCAMAMLDFETKTSFVDFTDNEIHSDSNIILPVIDDEETLILEEESRLKILSDDFGKRFTPQQELSAEQAFWLRMSNPTSKPSDASPVKIEAPKELPKVSLVNESLKKLKFHLARFDNVVKIRTTPDARYKRKRNEFYDKCFNLDAELLKSQNAHNDLLKSYSQLENILQDKDTTICKLKEIIKSIKEKSKEENVNYDHCEIETKNIELENSVAKLVSENEHLCNEINHVKQTFKEKFDSIKKTHVHTKEQSDSLIDKLNLKSAKNEDLKAHIQDKVFVITSLKNDLQKLKGKEIVDIVAQTPSAYTIVLEMFKLDLEPLAPRLLQNREAHIEYLKYTQEQADILRGIELLVYVRDTCPNMIKLNEKKVVVTPKNKVKKVRFAEPLTSSRKPLIRSKPTSNRKNDRISRIPNIPFLLLCHDVGQICSMILENRHIVRIMGIGRQSVGNVISQGVYYIEGLGHNLFSVGKFCDADLEVAFQKNTCFIRNLEGVDLLFESRHTNLYTISLDDMLKTSPSGPGLHSMTPATSSSGLVPNTVSQQPCIPPNKDDWDHLFQPMFDEYFNPPSIDVSPVQEAAAPRVMVLADSLVLTSIDQDYPSIRSSYSKHDWRSFSLCLYKKATPNRTMCVIFDAFLTFCRKQRNFKQAMIEPSWIIAMQEEIHEFERLQVWELVPYPDKVLLIKLKWIYKVKTDEFGGVLKNKARLVAQGFRQEEGIDFEELFASVA